MKTQKYKTTSLVTSILLLMVTCTLFTACSHRKDAMKTACKANKEKGINKDISGFLMKAADASMMNSYAGKLAFEKGSTASIKEYGQMLITDHTELMREIRKLATKYNVTLPDSVSNMKACMSKKLESKSGKDFDRKFTKMMCMDHKCEIKNFKKGAKMKEEDIRTFAENYLPMLQTHLDKVEKLRDMPENKK